MSTANETKLLDLVQWAEQAVQLKDFIGKHPVPNIVKVIKGQYRNYIGIAKSVHSNLYLYSVSTGRKILAESVKLKEGKRAVLSDQKYAIPLSYQGWFEVLSEDGKAVKAIESIKELATTYMYSKNNKYLVRENIKAFLGLDNGELSTEQRVIYVGDVISVTSELWLTQNTPKGMIKRKVLACKESSSVDSFYLDFEQKGLFSPIAGQQNISGVHNVQAMLQKFRLPITVRLVNGIIPTKMEKNFTGVFRLLHIYSDETAFLCPLKKDSKMVPVSTREPLRIVHATNFEEVKELDEFEQIHERCANMYNSFMNSIHLLFSLPEPEAIASVKKKSDSKTDDKIGNDLVEEDILFEEVEDIYQYVRDGGPNPPAPRPRPPRVPPPLPEKKGSTKAKLAHLGRSLVNKLSTKEKEAEYQSAAKPETPDERKSAEPFDPPTPPELPTKKNKQSQYPSQEPPKDYNTTEPTIPLRKFSKHEWDWEEPIYEPLDKIRKQKKHKETKQEINLDAAPQLVSDPSENFRVLSNSYNSPNEKPLPIQKRTEETAVQNLRQIYKQHSVHEGATKETKQMSPVSFPTKVAKTNEIIDQGMRIPEPDYEDNPAYSKPPPVPPKNFDDSDIRGTHSQNSHSSDSDKPHDFDGPVRQLSRSQVSNSDNHVHRVIANPINISSNSSPNMQAYNMRKPQQKHLPRGVPTTVHIEAAPHAGLAVHSHSGRPRVSIVADNRVSHPPYVAVAHVGDDERYSNGGRQISRGNSEHARRKLQSMYL